MYCCRYSVYHIYYVKFIQRTYLPICLYCIYYIYCGYSTCGIYYLYTIKIHIYDIYIYVQYIYIYVKYIYILYCIYSIYILHIIYMFIYMFIYIYIHHTYTLYYIKITKETIPPATIGLAAEKTTPPLPRGGGGEPSGWEGGGVWGSLLIYIYIRYIKYMDINGFKWNLMIQLIACTAYLSSGAAHPVKNQTLF